jgi:peptidoglycan/xylan/chitin deacetylase (PgdA/CDA1 family)
MRALGRALVIAAALAGCQEDIADVDGAFYDWSGRAMHCAVDIDSSTYNDLGSIDSALDRAAARGQVAEVYAHHPGVSVPVSTIEHVLAGARQRGLAFVTYQDLADEVIAPQPGVALSFDDTAIDAWHDLLPLLATYDARVTFFVSEYPSWSDASRGQLRELAAAGHAVEAHTVRHLRGPDYVEAEGLAAYLADEVVPSIALLQADGYQVGAFAYPYGARTHETDRAILPYVRVLRSVVFTWPEVESPCPL